MIHTYPFRDLYIALDVNSGAVHVTDASVYQLLQGMEQATAEEAAAHFQKLEGEAAEDIRSLIREGMLFTDDSYITSDLLQNSDAVVKAMCLHVAHDCNMVCDYCFGDRGAFAGSKCLMNAEVGKKAIDFLLENSGSRKNLEIDFFGGEPLMNFEVVRELVDYGRLREREYGKNIRFTMTTNGLLLDEEKAAYLNEVMDNVILSIDGRPEVHDRMRKTVSGASTYDKILPRYLHFTENREKLYYVRGTFTRRNLDFSRDVEHLTGRGFRNVSVEPVVADPTREYALREEDRDRIFAEYDRLADLYLEKASKGEAFDFFHFNVDLEQGPCLLKRLAGCGAGTEYLAVSPEGDLYPCHQFVGNREFRIGNLADEAIVNNQRDIFLKTGIYDKEECRGCWARFYCSGGCHANAVNINGDMMEPYRLGCDMERKRVECAIGIRAVLETGSGKPL